MKYSDFIKTSYYKEAIKAAGSPTFGLSRPTDGIFVGDHYHKIVLSRIIMNIYTLKPAGLAVIGVDAGKIGSQYLDNAEDDVDMFVIDRDGLIITASNPSWIGKRDLELPYFADSDPKLTVKKGWNLQRIINSGLCHICNRRRQAGMWWWLIPSGSLLKSSVRFYRSR